MDTPSPDREPHPAHYILLGANVVIVENLRGLEQIDRDVFELIVVPLPLKGLEASPVRAIARRVLMPVIPTGDAVSSTPPRWSDTLADGTMSRPLAAIRRACVTSRASHMSSQVSVRSIESLKDLRVALALRRGHARGLGGR